MTEDLLRFKNNQKYLIFDYETCNLNLGLTSNKPWQLGFLVCQGKKIIEKKDFYISWDNLKVSADAARITGFSKSKYNRLKKDANNVLEEFEKYLFNDEYIIIGHNVLGFDVYIHNLHRKLLKKPPNYSYINRVIDTNCIARGVKNDISFSKDSKLIEWQYKLLHHRVRGVKTNLKQLCKDYSIEFDENFLHDALYDVEKTFEVYHKMIWQIEI
jgi:DNA polymerase III epsilon subunit-like protein